ncbi:hypothetical protein BOP93_13155 [Pseudomonas orientalis]|uniref:Uncharacterized protein n=1 Tax=Pseudomonas orientalis TaxID=76758 RepID=A0A2L0RWQ3_9PSED|nr:hypothetical protein BOP93_13155 [Pseudomonas orientalis]
MAGIRKRGLDLACLNAEGRRYPKSVLKAGICRSDATAAMLPIWDSGLFMGGHSIEYSVQSQKQKRYLVPIAPRSVPHHSDCLIQ